MCQPAVLDGHAEDCRSVGIKPARIQVLGLLMLGSPVCLRCKLVLAFACKLCKHETRYVAEPLQHICGTQQYMSTVGSCQWPVCKHAGSLLKNFEHCWQLST